MENWRTSFKTAIFLWRIILSIAGCEYNCQEENYGLDTVIAIHLDTKNLSVLQHSSYAKTPVNARIDINDQTSNGNVAIAGCTSVDDYKKSYDIYLETPFMDRHTYRLSAMNGDPSAMRSLVALHVYSAAGLDTVSAMPVALWMNGEYLGLYLLLEIVNEEFFRIRNETPISLYQAENSRASMKTSNPSDTEFSTKIGAGDLGDLRSLSSLINEATFNTNREQIEKAVNLDAVLSYMAASHYIDNNDGLINNYFYSRTHQNPRFTFIPWDLDKTFRSLNDTSSGDFFRENQMMWRFHDKKGGYREKYDEAYRSLLGKVSPQQLSEYVDNLTVEMESAFNADPYLSGNGATLKDNGEILKDRFSKQSEILNVNPENMHGISR